jgi:hypothetical protein
MTSRTCERGDVIISTTVSRGSLKGREGVDVERRVPVKIQYAQKVWLVGKKLEEDHDMVTVGLKLNVSNENLQRYVRYAISHGYCRENPRKPWTEKEYKEVIRYASIRAVVDAITPYSK